MDIIISNSDGRPIYEQIITQMKSLIIQNELKEGELLPSMRFLAKELRISVITTKRAYEELEREGYLVSVAGKGTFVAKKNIEIIREEQKKQVEAHLSKAVECAKESGITKSEMIGVLNILYEGE